MMEAIAEKKVISSFLHSSDMLGLCCLLKVLVFTLLVFLLCTGEAEAGPPPGADFHLAPSVEYVIIGIVFVVAVVLYFILTPVKVVHAFVSLVLLIPIVEEFLFRLVLTYVFAVYMVGWPPYKAVVIIGMIFGMVHLFTVFISASPPFTAPPGLPVCEGLFIGCFNGLLFFNLMQLYNTGLLITMVYVWLTHILINVVIVAYNIVINVIFGGSFLIHLAPRFVLAVTAILWFVWCWMHQTVITGTF
jgi:hypothetical protein